MSSTKAQYILWHKSDGRILEQTFLEETEELPQGEFTDLDLENGDYGLIRIGDVEADWIHNAHKTHYIRGWEDPTTAELAIREAYPASLDKDTILSDGEDTATISGIIEGSQVATMCNHSGLQHFVSDGKNLNIVFDTPDQFQVNIKHKDYLDGNYIIVVEDVVEVED